MLEVGLHKRHLCASYSVFMNPVPKVRNEHEKTCTLYFWLQRFIRVLSIRIQDNWTVPLALGFPWTAWMRAVEYSGRKLRSRIKVCFRHLLVEQRKLTG